MKPLTTQHKHATMIKLWADGAPIQFTIEGSGWKPIARPMWVSAADYRVDPDFLETIDSRMDDLMYELYLLSDLRDNLQGG